MRSARAAIRKCAARAVTSTRKRKIPRLNILDVQRADPQHAQTGRGHGGGLRHRRRPRSARGLRSHHRRGQCPFRTDRPESRLVRRGIGLVVSGPHRGTEKSARDLVSLPPVRRAAGLGHGSGQYRRAIGTPRGRDHAMVPRNAGPLADGSAFPQGGHERRLWTARSAFSTSAAARHCSITCPRKHRKGAMRSSRSENPISRNSSVFHRERSPGNLQPTR